MCTAFKNASEENEPNQHGTCSVQLLHHLPGTGDLALLIAFLQSWRAQISSSNNEIITCSEWSHKHVPRVKQGPKVTLVIYQKQEANTPSALSTAPFHFSCHYISACIYCSTKTRHMTSGIFSVWSCDTPTTPPGPSFSQLLLPMWKPWQRPVGTSLWHIAFILCEVWGRVQVLLWEKMEPGP